MIITMGNDVAGQNIASYICIVRGIVVRSPSISQNFFGKLKSVIGGNIESYANMCETARQQAYDRMIKHATEVGADAVIGFRYDATDFAKEATEVLAYGTAVKFG